MNENILDIYHKTKTKQLQKFYIEISIKMSVELETFLTGNTNKSIINHGCDNIWKVGKILDQMIASNNR